MTPQHMDLFAGTGGFSLAAHRAGYETNVFVEKNPFFRKVLAQNFPGVPIIRDIKKFDPTPYVHSTYSLSAGIPCQPFSKLGKGLGTRDHRWLWAQTCATIEAVEPRWVIIENVPDFARMALAEVIADLERIGYQLPTDHCGTPIIPIIPAAACGADHLRSRLWILAHSQSPRWSTIDLSTLTRSQKPLRADSNHHAQPGRNRPTSKAGILGIYDALPHRVDKFGARRITAMGNAIYPDIAQKLLSWMLLV